MKSFKNTLGCLCVYFVCSIPPVNFSIHTYVCAVFVCVMQVVVLPAVQMRVPLPV